MIWPDDWVSLRTTVSRSFSNHPAINPETRARVLALAEELGYRYSVPRSGRARERLRPIHSAS